MGWRNVPAVRFLEEQIPECRVLLENETRAIAQAECTLGRAAEERNVAVLNLGESVNAATLLNREIYRGGDGWAGEIGHVIVEPDGAPCICGQRGCLRTKLALGPVLEEARRIYPGVDLAGLVEYAQRGEADAETLVEQVVNYACVAVSLMLNAYAPEKMILCGNMLWSAPALRERIQRRCWERMGRHMPYPVPICADTFGPDGRLIGGGIQAFQQALEDILAGAEPGRTAMEPEKN